MKVLCSLCRLCSFLVWIFLEFFIRCESPELVIVENFLEPVTLYCVSSTHGGSQYTWSTIVGEAREFPSTPIIYVNKEGIYQCIVKFEGKEIKGKVVTVRVDVGMLLSNRVM